MEKNMEIISSYNVVKNAIWNCVLVGEDSDIPRSEQEVNLVMLRDILLEINIYIQFVHLHVRYETRMSEQGRLAQLNPATYQVRLNRLAN